MADTTDRLDLPFLEGTDLASDIDQGFQDLAEAVDDIAVVYEQGTFASRPTSSPGTPGIEGRFYYATDTEVLYYDMGTGWLDLSDLLPDGSVTTADLADGAVTPAKLSTFDQVLAYSTSDQQCDDNDIQTIIFDSEHYDTNSMHSLSNTTTMRRLVAKKAGMYHIWLNLPGWDISGTNGPLVSASIVQYDSGDTLIKTLSSILVPSKTPSGSQLDPTIAVGCAARMSLNDYVVAQIGINGAGNNACGISTSSENEFGMVLLGP